MAANGTQSPATSLCLNSGPSAFKLPLAAVYAPFILRCQRYSAAGLTRKSDFFPSLGTAGVISSSGVLLATQTLNPSGDTAAPGFRGGANIVVPGVLS